MGGYGAATIFGAVQIGGAMVAPAGTAIFTTLLCGTKSANKDEKAFEIQEALGEMGARRLWWLGACMRCF